MTREAASLRLRPIAAKCRSDGRSDWRQNWREVVSQLMTSRRHTTYRIALLATLAVLPALAIGRLTPAQQQRVDRLYTIFVAPCCWKQSVAVHQSPEAARVRAEIDSRVASGLTDSEIKSDLIREYGHGILLEPEGGRALAAYAGPSFAVAGALLAAVSWIRRLAKPRDPADNDPGSMAGQLPDLEDE